MLDMHTTTYNPSVKISFGCKDRSLSLNKEETPLHTGSLIVNTMLTKRIANEVLDETLCMNR